jgi:hypothetical protein
MWFFSAEIVVGTAWLECEGREWVWSEDTFDAVGEIYICSENYYFQSCL